MCMAIFFCVLLYQQAGKKYIHRIVYSTPLEEVRAMRSKHETDHFFLSRIGIKNIRSFTSAVLAQATQISLTQSRCGGSRRTKAVFHETRRYGRRRRRLARNAINTVDDLPAVGEHVDSRCRGEPSPLPLWFPDCMSPRSLSCNR